jgi:uncharacterized protein (TIGR03083 family)
MVDGTDSQSAARADPLEDPMPDTTIWIAAVRSSHDRLAGLLGHLGADDVRKPSYASEWSIADVASHLGSQAEIFGLFLAAGLSGSTAPGSEAFPPIWDRWNALTPTEQVTQSVAANEAFVRQLEAIPADEADRFELSMFGRDLDLAGLAAMRLGEHAVHTWDVAVALDPAATVAPDAVTLLIDTVAHIADRATPMPDLGPVPIDTTAPDRRFLLTAHPVVSLAVRADPADAAMQLTSEQFVRLVYGRLDAVHTPDNLTGDVRLADLRRVFPGF